MRCTNISKSTDTACVRPWVSYESDIAAGTVDIDD